MNIHEVKFFNGIDQAVVEEIKTACTAKAYAAEDIIFEKGSPADCLYILEKGSIDLLLKKADNLVYTLDSEGEVFGWSSIVEKGVYTSTATCVTDASVLCISKKDIEGIFDRNTEAAVTFYRRLGSIFSKRITRAVE
jgi:signal-transduction protein with cAMP-binding, CBS, and nucleotidyltransferase domain